MRILFLTSGESNALADWLAGEGETVRLVSDPVAEEDMNRWPADWLVSYNYRHIVKKNILEKFRGKAINLHISYLPWNRGADPNLWSHIEDTPKGVTIHEMDEGVDTGNILVQKEVELKENLTLKESYDLLHDEIQALFKQWWPSIQGGKLISQPQQGAGSIHRTRDREPFISLLGEDGWDLMISEFKQRLRKKRIHL